MLIRRLTLDNFGLFRGVNEIVLAPRSIHGHVRPVVLIGGKNGAGKTTLLEAIRLCLYGVSAVGQRVGQRQYEVYLRSRIHRDEVNLLQPDYASVALEFDYAERGDRRTYRVERAWKCCDEAVESRLTVLRDGEPLDELDRTHADEFLRELIPPGVSQLYFFDGEKIQELAETEEDDSALAIAIRGLLGLEMVERLQSDLRIYTGRLKDAPKADPISTTLNEIVQKRELLEEQRVIAMRQVDESKSRKDRCRKECALSEQRLAL